MKKVFLFLENLQLLPGELLLSFRHKKYSFMFTSFTCMEKWSSSGLDGSKNVTRYQKWSLKQGKRNAVLTVHLKTFEIEANVLYGTIHLVRTQNFSARTLGIRESEY